MTIGQIFDRSTEILKKRYLSLWWIFLAQGLLSVIERTSCEGIFLTIALFILNLVSQLFIFLVTFYAAEGLWNRNSSSLREVLTKVRNAPLLNLVEMFVRVLFWTVAGLVLLVVPGIIYATNRVLSPYFLLFEGLSVDDSLRKSKFFFTREPWYSLRGALMRFSWIALLTVTLGVLVEIIFNLSIPVFDLTKSTGGLEQIPAFFLVIMGAIILYTVKLYIALVYFGFYTDLKNRYDQ